MAVGTGTFGGGLFPQIKKMYKAGNDALMGDADLYRQALEKSAYGALVPAFSRGIQGIQGQLSRMGPLADSGANAALTARLASNLYGGAASQVGQGYSAYLANLLQQRRQYNYQLALMKKQAKLGKKKPLDYLAGAAGGAGGFLLGGPAGAAAGYGIGSNLGGGGTFGSDSLYYG